MIYKDDYLAINKLDDTTTKKTSAQTVKKNRVLLRMQKKAFERERLY
jgi:hypothetical protein